MKADKIVNFFFEIASLRRLTRSHRQVIQDVNDNVSDHSFRVAVIGMILAKLEKCNTDKVIKIALFHDMAEARTGDANAINKYYLDLHEKEAINDQVQDLPVSKEIIELFREYEERETKESIVAKDADMLDQMILQQEYFFKDKENNKLWQNYTEQRLTTNNAKILALKIRESNPFEWLYSLVERKSGKKIKR